MILCWHRQRKNTVPPWMNEIPMLLFIRHTHSEDFLFWENPHLLVMFANFWCFARFAQVSWPFFVGFGDSFVSQRLVSFVSIHTKEWSKWQASENEDKTVISL